MNPGNHTQNLWMQHLMRKCGASGFRQRCFHTRLRIILRANAARQALISDPLRERDPELDHLPRQKLRFRISSALLRNRPYHGKPDPGATCLSAS